MSLANNEKYIENINVIKVMTFLKNAKKQYYDFIKKE
jgi:hypothetical protein